MPLVWAGMFGFFAPRPPLSTFQRVDIELLMRRNVELVGRDAVVRSDVITDLAQLAIDTSTPERLLETAVAEVAMRLGMTDTTVVVSLEFDSEADQPSTYQPPTESSSAQIQISREIGGDPLRCVMEIAYQYAHHYWCQQPNTRELDTQPRTTTLLPICFGLGVLAGHAALYDRQWSVTGYSGWSFSRSGYYNPAEIGYAVALLARMRGESKPSWLSALRLDSKVAARGALRYFSDHDDKGGELLFDAGRIPGTDRDRIELTNWMRGEDPAFAMASALALAQLDSLPSATIEAAVEATRSTDHDLAIVATRLLGASQVKDAGLQSRLRELSHSNVAPIALAALESASRVGMPMGEFSRALARLLDHRTLDVVPVARLIGDQGQECRWLAPKVCKQLVAAIKYGDEAAVESLLDCLSKISDAPTREVDMHIKALEVRRQVLLRLSK